MPPPPKAKAVTVATTPPPTATRRQLLVAAVAIASTLRTAAASAAAPRFAEIPGSGGVKALDLREGSGEVPADGDQVAIHYYGRLAAKQGWRFDSTYDHKDEAGDPMPFVFTVGSGKVIPGIEVAVKSMRVGGLRRVIIPPSQGYQNTSQEPIPPNETPVLSIILDLLLYHVTRDQLKYLQSGQLLIIAFCCKHNVLKDGFVFFDRQRLFTTIFNPTRLANGEGSTLGTLIFDIELISMRQHS